MTIEEQKEILIEKIKIEEDGNMLNAVYHLLERDFAIGETETIYLTNAQKKGVQKGLDDIEAGRVLSNEEMQARIKNLLKD